jgi:putative nucleotidyltransferase with HDIG domain
MGHYRVLIVDDDEAIRKMLGRFLDHLGYSVELAQNTGQAIALLDQSWFDLVLTDVRMPGADGMELLAWITRHRPDTGTVMLSGCDDLKLAVRAMKAGALDYIEKPFALADVGETIGRAIGRKKESVERLHYLEGLERTLKEQSGHLRDTLDQLHEASEETLEALVTALDARERETQSHSQRVSEYSVRLGEELGLQPAELEVIRQGSMLHDIGKIGIPDRILLKPERLTADEWVEMRKHPEIGAWIVNGVDSLKPASDIVIAHHERFDGQGYPHHLGGETIPLGARLFAVADTLDAVLSDRPYRSGSTYQAAREEIERNAGTQFDPEIAACFLHVPASAWDDIRERTCSRYPSSLVLT